MKIKYESVNEIKIRILEMRIFLCGKIENKIKINIGFVIKRNFQISFFRKSLLTALRQKWWF